MGLSSLPQGLIVDLVTPLDPNGDLDERSLSRLLDRVLPYVQGLFLAGPHGGEGGRLGGTRRAALLRKTIDLIQGETPLFLWVTQPSPQSTIETLRLLQKEAETAGYAGPVFWVDTPLYYQGNRGLPRYYRDLVTQFPQGWLLYNDPSLIKSMGRPLKRNNIRTSILKEVCSIEGILGLIFSGPLDRAHNYQKAVRTRPEFRIYDGEESRFLSHPSRSGVVSIGANLAPKAWQKITNSTLNLGGSRKEYPDRLQQVWETGAHLAELMGLYSRAPAALLKEALFRTGILDAPHSLISDVDPGKIREIAEWTDRHEDLVLQRV
jgi:dihydrodipicolinate synthase/N-acetylneuraminate lyase